MKLVMFIVDDEKKEQLEVLLGRAGIVGFTEIAHAAGVGRSGLRLGSRAFPRTSAIIFTFLPDDAVEPLAAEIRRWCADCGERLRMIAWGAEQLL